MGPAGTAPRMTASSLHPEAQRARLCLRACKACKACGRGGMGTADDGRPSDLPTAPPQRGHEAPPDLLRASIAPAQQLRRIPGDARHDKSPRHCSSSGGQDPSAGPHRPNPLCLALKAIPASGQPATVVVPGAAKSKFCAAPTDKALTVSMPLFQCNSSADDSLILHLGQQQPSWLKASEKSCVAVLSPRTWDAAQQQDEQYQSLQTSPGSDGGWKFGCLRLLWGFCCLTVLQERFQH